MYVVFKQARKSDLKKQVYRKKGIQSSYGRFSTGI